MHDVMIPLALEGGPKTIEEPLPFVGYGAELIGAEEEASVLEAIRSRKLCRITHPFKDSFVHRFEQAVAARSGSPYVLALNSCASALHVAMVALNIGPGDEVLISSAGWFSIASAVINVGAIPIPVDFDESLSMDPEDFERKITPRTRAVILVQWRGLPADMDRILPIAQAHGVKVVEDVAQSFGATYHGRFLGTLGDIGCYSFNMHKMITAGEGGAIVMREGPLYKRAGSFSGFYNFYRHHYDDGEKLSMPQMPMINYRMPELCGAMAVAQMPKLDGLLAGFRARNRELVEGLRDQPGIRFAPRHDPEGECGYTLPLVFETPEQATFFFDAMRAEGATNISNLSYGFGGGEARGTAELASSEHFEAGESGLMVLAERWRCVTERNGPTDGLNPWKLSGRVSAPAGEVTSKTRERLSRVVALKINAGMEQRHTEGVVRAARKVGSALVSRFGLRA